MNREDTAAQVAWRDGYKCVVCGKKGSQIAHLIPQGAFGKAFIKRVLRESGYPDRWHQRVMHAVENLRLVCGLECNSSVSISNHPIFMTNLVLVIARRIEAE